MADRLGAAWFAHASQQPAKFYAYHEEMHRFRGSEAGCKRPRLSSTTSKAPLYTARLIERLARYEHLKYPRAAHLSGLPTTSGLPLRQAAGPKSARRDLAGTHPKLAIFANCKFLA